MDPLLSLLLLLLLLLSIGGELPFANRPGSQF